MKTKLTFFFAFLFLSLVSFGQWTMQNSGFSTTNTGIGSIAIVNANVVWASSFDSSWTNAYQDFTRTTNGGTTWTTGQINGANGYYITSITAISQDTAWVSMADLNNGGGRIYKTTNGGANWSRQNNSAFSGGYGWADAMYFWNANEGVCMGDSNNGWWEFYYTTDGGTNWNLVSQANLPVNLPGEYGQDNTYSVIGNTIWFGTDQGRVYKSTDKGVTWTVSQTGLGAITSIAFKDANNGLAEDGGYLEATTDGGLTWNSVNANGDVFDAFMCYAPGSPGAYFTSEYGGGYGGTSYSTDNGVTWITVDTTEHGAIKFLNQNVGWCGGWNQSTTVDGMWKWNGTIGIQELNSPYGLAKVFPNPVNESAEVILPGGIENAVFILYNSLGEKAEELDGIKGNRFIFERGDLPAGIYFYEIHSEKGLAATGKIMIN